MPTSREKILSHYASYQEENRATSSRANGIEFHFTRKILNDFIKKESNIIELGCGTGHYGMHFADRCSRYTGVDLSPDNIATFQNKILAEGKENIRAVVGNAMSVPEFSDNSFDVVLCLGPMYHLKRSDRMKVFGECKRIAKKDATLAFAYINSIGAYAGWCVNDDSRGMYPNDAANQYFLDDHVAYDNPDVFFLTSPEEMEHDAMESQLETIQNNGLDFFFAQTAINGMSDEQFASYMALADAMSNSPSCTGLADHALLVCRK